MPLMFDDYGENTPTIAYGPDSGEWFVYYRVCPKCGRYVKPDDGCRLPEYQRNDPNATCKKCGRVQMPFAWWWSPEEEEII
ncbi:MAG: hypothetical protein J6W09_04550 [Bacteroidales bacterium]|nr:hypothetical protein [Bacteroidales bacterium]